MLENDASKNTQKLRREIEIMYYGSTSPGSSIDKRETVKVSVPLVPPFSRVTFIPEKGAEDWQGRVDMVNLLAYVPGSPILSGSSKMVLVNTW